MHGRETVTALLVLLLSVSCATAQTPVTPSPVSENSQRYFADIHGKIAGCTQLPAAMSDEQKRLFEVTVRIVVDENGALQSATIDKSSGSADYDEAILQAVHCAEPFAKPDVESKPFVTRGLVLSFKP